MSTQPTSASEAIRLIEERRYSYFTFPTLQITIKYRNPDMLKLAMNKQLPLAMADIIIDAYKTQLAGGNVDDLQEKHKNFEMDDQFLAEVREKGYNILSELCTSFTILDVKQSDPESGVLAWKDIPEQDAMAFLSHLMLQLQRTALAEGGETTSDEVASFPDGTRLPKRNSARKSGKDVRQAAS